MGESTPNRWTFLGAMAVGLAATAALATASASIADTADGTARSPDGTARFSYVVTDFSYAGKGYVLGGRETTGACVAGVTSNITGFATSSPADVPSAKLGRGEMTIGPKDTNGVILAGNFFDFDLTGGFEQSTACEGGTTAMVANTTCNSVVTSKVLASAAIKGGVGDTVRITWSFGQDEVAGGWFPDFVCVAGARFEEQQCRSKKIALSTLTRRKIRLRFLCDIPLTTTPPAGKGYDRYEAFSKVSGVIRLKTDRR